MDIQEISSQEEIYGPNPWISMDFVSIHGVWIGFTYIQIHPEELENVTIGWMDELGTLGEID
jgi:hypothetical protein